MRTVRPRSVSSFATQPPLAPEPITNESKIFLRVATISKIKQQTSHYGKQIREGSPSSTSGPCLEPFRIATPGWAEGLGLEFYRYGFRPPGYLAWLLSGVQVCPCGTRAVNAESASVWLLPSTSGPVIWTGQSSMGAPAIP